MINTDCVQIKNNRAWTFQIQKHTKERIWFHVKDQLSLTDGFFMWDWTLKYRVVWKGCYKIDH